MICEFDHTDRDHSIPGNSVNINRLRSLQLTVCAHFIPSLLLSADVQSFCSEKESLFVTLESFKERETTRPHPSSPSTTIHPTKQQISIYIQSLLPAECSPPATESCKVHNYYLFHWQEASFPVMKKSCCSEVVILTDWMSSGNLTPDTFYIDKKTSTAIEITV